MSQLRIRLGQVAIVMIGAGLMAGMMLTNPDHDRGTRPFIRVVSAGETGQTRMIGGRFDSWRTADVIDAGGVRLDTQGVFLIAEMILHGTRTSTGIDAYWIGNSGRRYAATRRIRDLPRQSQHVFLQPGLTTRTMAIFEVPPDEITGGAILLTMPYDPMLDGTLRLLPPTALPQHGQVESFGK